MAKAKFSLLTDKINEFYGCFKQFECIFYPTPSLNRVRAIGSKFREGCVVRFYASETFTMPTGLYIDTNYYVHNVAGDYFNLLDESGNLVEFTTSGSGTISCQLYLTEDQRKYVVSLQEGVIPTLQSDIVEIARLIQKLDISLNTINNSVIPPEYSMIPFNSLYPVNLDVEAISDGEIYCTPGDPAIMSVFYRIYTDNPLQVTNYDRAARIISNYCVGTSMSGSGQYDTCPWTPTNESADFNRDWILTTDENTNIRAENSNGQIYQWINHSFTPICDVPYYFSIRAYDVEVITNLTADYNTVPGYFTITSASGVVEVGDVLRIYSSGNTLPSELSDSPYMYYFVYSCDGNNFNISKTINGPKCIPLSSCTGIIFQKLTNNYTAISNPVIFRDNTNILISYTVTNVNNDIKISITDNSGVPHGFYVERIYGGWVRYHRFERIATIGPNESPQEYVDADMPYAPSSQTYNRYRVQPFTFENETITKLPYLEDKYLWSGPPFITDCIVLNLVGTVLSSSQIILNWKLLHNDSNNNLICYDIIIERAVKSDGSWENWQRMNKTGIDLSDTYTFNYAYVFYYDETVLPSTTYKYRVSYDVLNSTKIETQELTTMDVSVGTIVDMMNLSPRTEDTAPKLVLTSDLLQTIKNKRNPLHKDYDQDFASRTQVWVDYMVALKEGANFLNNASYWSTMGSTYTNPENTPNPEFNTVGMVLAYYLAPETDNNRYKFLDRFWEEMSYGTQGILYRPNDNFAGYDEPYIARQVARAYDWVCDVFDSMSGDWESKKSELEQWIVNRVGSYSYRINISVSGTSRRIDGSEISWRRDNIGIGNNLIRSYNSLAVAFVCANIPDNIVCTNSDLSLPTVDGHEHYDPNDTAKGKTPKELANKVIGIGLASIKQSLDLYAPSGGFMGGPGYYLADLPGTTEFPVMIEDFLGVSIFDIYNHEDSRFGPELEDSLKLDRGFYKTCLFPMLVRWPHGKLAGVDTRNVTAFKYGDGWAESRYSASEYLLATRANDYYNTDLYMAAINYANSLISGIDLHYIFYHVKSQIPTNILPESVLMKGKEVEVCSMISDWDEDFPAKVGIKAGGWIYDHTHWDKGTYEFHAKGVMWTHDLGYNTTWNYWRQDGVCYPAITHNTLLIDSIDQDTRDAPMYLDESKKICHIDLSPCYRAHVESAHRYFKLTGHNLEVKDVVVFNAPVELISQFLTSANVEISSNGKILKLIQQRKVDLSIVEYYAVIDSSADYTWDVSHFRRWNIGVNIPYDTDTYYSTLKMAKIIIPPSSDLSATIKYTFKEVL